MYRDSDRGFPSLSLSRSLSVTAFVRLPHLIACVCEPRLCCLHGGSHVNINRGVSRAAWSLSQGSTRVQRIMIGVVRQQIYWEMSEKTVSPCVIYKPCPSFTRICNVSRLNSVQDLKKKIMFCSYTFCSLWGYLLTFMYFLCQVYLNQTLTLELNLLNRDVQKMRPSQRVQKSTKFHH